MARVHFVKKAMKDYPEIGVKKGESYYWWQHFRQHKQMSKERPPQSRTAGSEYARSVFALVEELETWQGEWTESDRDELVGSLEEIRDQEQDKYDNMPEGLQQGDTGMLLEDRVAALDEWISELENIDFEEQEEEEEGEEEEEKEEKESPLEIALASAIQP